MLGLLEGSSEGDKDGLIDGITDGIIDGIKDCWNNTGIFVWITLAGLPEGTLELNEGFSVGNIEGKKDE